jgi:ubiquinone/menaquinone biosynthesis C-methylase UbiE
MSRLQGKVGGQAQATKVLRAPAEDLPFDDNIFDIAFCT